MSISFEVSTFMFTASLIPTTANQPKTHNCSGGHHQPSISKRSLSIFSFRFPKAKFNARVFTRILSIFCYCATNLFGSKNNNMSAHDNRRLFRFVLRNSYTHVHSASFPLDSLSCVFTKKFIHLIVTMIASCSPNVLMNSRRIIG